MDLNQLVCENQSIKIVPSVEDSLITMGVDVHIDAHTGVWFDQLKLKWKTWKKSIAVDNHMESFLVSCGDPFRIGLLCIVKCPEFKDCKMKSLPYYILESINEWSQKYGILPPDGLKLPAFHVGIKQRNQNFLTLIIKTYQICTVKDAIVPMVKEMITNDNCKQALQIVTAMELNNDVPVEELLFPLILQDRASMIDEYLVQFPDQVKPLLTFLDRLLDKNFNILSFTQNFIYKNNVCNVKYNKIHYKPLGKLVARLCNKFNIPIEACKNLSKNRIISGLRYLVHQKYVEHNVSMSVWDDLVKDSLNNSTECAQEFIDILIGYDTNEALKWATYFKIPENDLPTSLKNLSLQDVQEEENWDDNVNNVSLFYKLPISDNKIIIIDSSEKFNHLITNLIDNNIIGIDCEWKPSFGASQSQVALMQIATYHNIYLIDTLILNDKQYTSLWYKFNKSLLDNAEIIKIGFGLEQDLKEIKSSITGLSNIRVKGEGLLDLGLLWKNLVNCGLLLPANNDNEGNSLSSLVQSCLGLPLNKDEQCSNWELRPLRNTQIQYAAIDAYVLVAIYNYLSKSCLEQAINFDEICNDVMLDKKPKSTKKTKVVDRLLLCKYNYQFKNIQSVRLLLESELAPLLPYLRYLGMDATTMPQAILWHDAINLAISEERIILTSKMKFSPTVKLPQSHILEVGKVVANASGVIQHITNILKTFDIIVQQSDLLSRCIRCNSKELKKLTPSEVNEFCSNKTHSNNANLYDNHRYSDNEDCDYDNFLSDSDDDSCLYQVANMPNRICVTSKGVDIELGDIEKLVEAKKPATLCESCGKIYWDEDLLLKSVCDINSLVTTIS